MIGQPSIAKLLRSISHDLREVMAPAVNDAAVGVTVQMMASLLDALARRETSQHRWMAEESAAIRGVAEAMLGSDAATLAMRAAYDALQATPFADDPAAHYEKASELLSCAAEAALQARSDEHRLRVKTLLDQRLQNEVEIIGENFQVVGRS